MFKTRKIGLGMAMVFGLMATVPAISVNAQRTQASRTTAMSGTDPCVTALNDIRAAQATLTQIKQLGEEIKARHARLEAGAVAANDTEAPLKCPACGMMMPTKPTGNLTKAVKYKGVTYYCCKGCDMSATADKE